MLQCRKLQIFAIFTFFVAGALSPPIAAGVTKSEGDFFKIQVKTENKAQKMVAVVEVVPTPGYHINKEYPWKITPKASKEVAFEREVYKKSDAKVFVDAKVVFEIPYQAKAGAKDVQVDIRFSMCDDKQCLIEKLSLVFPAR